MKKRIEIMETILCLLKIFVMCFIISYIIIGLFIGDLFLLNNTVSVKFLVIFLSFILVGVVTYFDLGIYFIKFKFGDLLIPITKINDYIKK